MSNFAVRCVEPDNTEQTLTFSGTVPATTGNMGGANFTMGNTSNSFDGRLDNFTIWNKALTQHWVTKDYVKSRAKVRVGSRGFKSKKRS